MDSSDDEAQNVSENYQLLFQMTFQWPCLSFDVVPDQLGAFRTNFPHACSVVSATQAAEGQENYLILTRISNLNSTKNDTELEEQGELQNPEIRTSTFFHPSTCNRIRAMKQNPNIIATWAEDRFLYIWDFTNVQLQTVENAPVLINPLFSIENRSEGYGLAWSNHVTGLIAIGTSTSDLKLFQISNGSISIRNELNSQQESVEDIVFSPQDENLLCTCGTNGTINIWDLRSFQSPSISYQASMTDVNVVDWNREQAYGILSGADNGEVRIWDLRNLEEPIFPLDYHESPITSVCWNPNDACEFAVSSEDCSVTIWDMSVENEEKEEGPEEDQTHEQMLFCHYVDTPKEIHYHPQIQSMIGITAETFELFIPDTLPADQ